MQLPECFAAGECEIELADELIEVVLHHTVEIDQFAVDVVEHFGFGGLLAQEKKRAASGEQLDVALMFGEHRQDVFCQAAFAAHPRNQR